MTFNYDLCDYIEDIKRKQLHLTVNTRDKPLLLQQWQMKIKEIQVQGMSSVIIAKIISIGK